ncbi:MAG: hypothetical protein ICV64_02660 [Thermoleophilia bacterium]|nr:hypothetical protein [Thermoleophilia bacterium]
MALPWSLRLYAVLVVAQWVFFALPGDPGASSVLQAVFWVVVQAALVLLLVLRGSTAAWAVLLVFTVLGALLLAAGLLEPDLTWGAAFVLLVAQLAALVAPGTRGHLRRGPAPV